MKRFYRIVILLLFLIFSSCDYMQPEAFEQQFVVESILVANNPLPTVNLFTTVQTNEQFSWGGVGVSGAIVEIYLLDEEGNRVETYHYEQVSKVEYHPILPGKVQAARKYELYVVIPVANDHVLRAYTRVPGEVRLSSAVIDTVIYQADQTPNVEVQIPDYPGRPNMIMNMYMADNPYYHNLTPYYASNAEEDTMSAYFDYFRQSQDLFSTANTPQKANQIFTITFPWKWFAYYGPYRIIINTLDDNFYDHLRSANVQFGGSTLAPGQIYSAIEHVEGGLGVFGSVATDTVYTYVKRNIDK